MKKILAILTLLSIISVSSFAYEPNNITYLTEEFPPYNYRGPDGHLHGISIDIIKEVFKSLGLNNKTDEIKLVPWDEVYQSMLFDKNVCGFSTTFVASREKLFKWVGPIIRSRTIVLGNDASPQLTNINNLKNYKLATIKNDASHHIAQKMGVPDENFVISENLGDVIRSYENGEADFIIYEESVIFWYLKRNGKRQQYKVFGSISENSLYYAFSKDVPDEFVSKFQNALDEIKSSEIYFDILDLYIK